MDPLYSGMSLDSLANLYLDLTRKLVKKLGDEEAIRAELLRVKAAIREKRSELDL